MNWIRVHPAQPETGKKLANQDPATSSLSSAGASVARPDLINPPQVILAAKTSFLPEVIIPAEIAVLKPEKLTDTPENGLDINTSRELVPLPGRQAIQSKSSNVPAILAPQPDDMLVFNNVLFFIAFH